MTTITKNFEGQSLTLVKDYSQLNWETYPILLSDGERKAIDFPYVVSVLKGTVHSPLTKEEWFCNLSPQIQTILSVENIHENGV
ncbi:MAG: hypothetical protein P4L16_06835 [Chlamydiales bacterium]|nr:hypothetical protein [Chlamydiales bacterium]